MIVLLDLWDASIVYINRIILMGAVDTNGVWDIWYDSISVPTLALWNGLRNHILI